jgi:putative nucleotide binding protein
MKPPLKKDEWARVLDFLPQGKQGMHRPEPVAQVVGEQYFSLLELILKEGTSLKVGDRVYIGDGKRDMVKYISGRIEPAALTVAAREELQNVLDTIIMENPQKFIDFFNKSGSVTTRMHAIELIPGIGKKHLWAIIEERKAGPFKDLADIKKRVPLLSDVRKMVIKRILDEMDDKDRYRIFVPKMEARR